MDYDIYRHEAKKDSDRAKRLGINLNELYRKDNQMAVEMTVKQSTVLEILEIKGINYPTKEVIREYSEMLEGRDEISERHVQRIRKWAKDNNVIKESKMDEQDVFDTGMDDWEINLLNKANEGGWSVQQLAQTFVISVEEVKAAITRNAFLLQNALLDEDSESVYWRPETGDVIELPETTPTQETLALAEIKEGTGGDGDFWEIKIDCVKSCSRVEQSVDVFMSRLAREKAMKFMKWAGAREWLAYLIGEYQEDGYHVHDLFLPDQRTSAALVDKVVAEEYNSLKVVGVIHSHHEMGAGDEDSPSFSGHDAAFINSNHNLSLLAGKSGQGFKVVGIARVKTPCEHFMQIKANVKVMKEDLSDDDQSLQDEFFRKTGMGQYDKRQSQPASRYFDKAGDHGHDPDNGSYHFSKNPQLRRG